MEISDTLTTYAVRNYFLSNLNSDLFLGQVKNPDNRDDTTGDSYWDSGCFDDEIAGGFSNEGIEAGCVCDEIEYKVGSIRYPNPNKSKDSSQDMSMYNNNGLILLKDTNKPLPQDTDELIKLCQPSKYGDLKTQTTVLNEEVRKAYEIPGDKLVMTNELLNQLENIKDEIKNMYPNVHEFIEFKINKLNVYTEGCHFKTHVDTPKDNMVGTLIIELPYDYKGGGFVLGTKGDEIWQRTVVVKNPKSQFYGRLTYCAFFSDTPHSVKEIKGGCRVSLTFYIMLDPGSTNIDNKVKDKVEINKYLSTFENRKKPIDYPNAIVELSDLLLSDVHHDKGPIGLLLSHNYSNSEINNGVHKGTDAHLINYIKNVENADSEYEISDVFPVVVTHREQWSFGTYGDEFVRQSVYRFCEEDIIATAKKMNNEPYKYVNTDKMPLPSIKNLITFYNIGIVNAYDESGEIDRDDYIDFTGNECQEGWMNGQYFQCAVIISKKKKEKKESTEQETE